MMRHRHKRLPLLLLSSFLACALLAACGEGGDKSPAKAPPGGTSPDSTSPGSPPPGGTSTAGGAETGAVQPIEDVSSYDALAPRSGPAFRTAAECGKCHIEIYNEWKASYHGRAMIDPLFRELSAGVDPEECIRCHAPVNLRASGFDTPVARSELREDAISCLSCHESGNNVAGPIGGLNGQCRPIGDPAQKDVVKMCFVCHNQHDTGNEWLRGPWSSGGSEAGGVEKKDCLDCHMPAVERPLVPGGPVRKGRRHTWFGGHSRQQLERAATLEVELKPLKEGGFRFTVYVTNVGAGHAIPSDARHRSFDTYLLLRDAQGNLILDPLQAKQQRRSHLAKFRKFYRGSGMKDTQIPPMERVSTRGDGKGYLEVPEAVSGTGEAWLVYRLTPRDVLNKRSLETDTPDDMTRLWQARVVIRKKFTYGP